MNEAAYRQLEARASKLEAVVDSLSAEREQLAAEREQYRKLYLQTLERCATLERGIVAGKQAERHTVDDSQLALQVLGMLLSPEDPAPAPDLSEETDPEVPNRERAPRRPTGRRKLPEHLPRVDIEVLPPEVQQEGLAAFKRIGEEVSEVIERRPESLVVVRLVRPKFVRIAEDIADASPVKIAEPPERPIERGLAGPGMLADTIVRRWQDHTPLHRQESIYARDGLELSRSTICGWHEQLADLVEPLVDAMLRDALESPYLCTDATGVLVRTEEQCQRAHFWVLVAPERHVLYRFSHKHDSAAVDRLLAGYKGYLVADAHSVYDHLYSTGDVVEVACWAHARRYFFKALSSDPERADRGLAWIKGLFRVERSIKTAPRKKREEARREKSRPIVDAFFAWCDEQAADVLDETPIARAIRYAQNQRAALMRFLDDGRLPLDNNVSERNLRREVLGRKNWLFLGSDEGARTNTLFVSLLASCQLHGIEPWAYLRDLFCVLPSWPRSRVLELAPAFWKQTRQHEDAQQRLAANVFRAVTLADHSPPV
ncbi:IS66 family transposase [Nannocystis exedens]|uniref:IS66 family transposase n=1 Tax=Nannocystis exedens TaxID=54 RepID=UPI000BBA0CF8|nr:IS66 family transposase [Nannocystis exedens]PCC73202.1 Transposase IS66 family protein [Nannocystis exedens]